MLYMIVAALIAARRAESTGSMFALQAAHGVSYDLNAGIGGRRAGRRRMMRSEKEPAPQSTRAAVSANSQILEVELRNQSLTLNRQLQALADQLKPGPPLELLRAFNLCAPCEHLERFGEEHDGGYVMCTDGLDKGLMAAYSYGVDGFDGWGMQVASRYHIPLHEYDCTNASRPTPCHDCEVFFHTTCLTSPRDESGRPDFLTLGDNIAANGHSQAAPGSLLLKVDTEGAEWHVFAEEPPELFKMYRQIVVEYHWLQETPNHQLNLLAVQNIANAGFAIAHLHGNNNEGMAYFENFSIPRVLEVTYVQKPTGGCSPNISYHLPIDRPNHEEREELPDAVLPAKQ